MKYSDVVKTMLLASINDLAANPENYALHPGKDFYSIDILDVLRILH